MVMIIDPLVLAAAFDDLDREGLTLAELLAVELCADRFRRAARRRRRGR